MTHQVLIKLVDSNNFSGEGFFGKDDKGKEKSLEAYVKFSIGKTKSQSETYKDKSPLVCFCEQTLSIVLLIL
jgi:hypothetical protein